MLSLPCRERDGERAMPASQPLLLDSFIPIHPELVEGDRLVEVERVQDMLQNEG
jgi:hypothetical protein